MDDDSYHRFVHEATHCLINLKEQCRAKFGIGSGQGEFHYDLDTGQMTFSFGGKPRVAADFLVVGSISFVTGTWLWSWANQALGDNLTKPIHQVREFGVQRGITRLIEHYWPAGEEDGWDMTAITAYLINAKGAYRAPFENGFLFFSLRISASLPEAAR